jgi:hypothetical protein
VTEGVHPSYRLTGRLDSFQALGPYERGNVLRHAVEVFALANVLYLRRVRTPLLYEAGVRYIDTGDEWRDVPAVLAGRGGDCKDLVAWRVAELRVRGRQAWPRIILTQDPSEATEWLYHVVVQFPGGAFEDPSRILGMP